MKVHDPQGMSEARHLLPADVVYCGDQFDVFKNADAVVLLTEWNVYRGIDMQRGMKLMKSPIFVDLRNVYERARMEELGFSYHCVGR